MPEYLKYGSRCKTSEIRSLDPSRCIFAAHDFCNSSVCLHCGCLNAAQKERFTNLAPHYQGESLPKSKSFTGETTWEMFDFYYRRNTRIIKLTRIAWVHQWVFNHWDCWNLKGLKSHRRAMPEETRCSRMERNAPAACGRKFNSTSGSMTVNETRFISIFSDLSKVSIPSLWAAKPSKRPTNSTFGENLWPLFSMVFEFWPPTSTGFVCHAPHWEQLSPIVPCSISGMLQDFKLWGEKGRLGKAQQNLPLHYRKLFQKN